MHGHLASLFLALESSKGTLASFCIIDVLLLLCYHTMGFQLSRLL